MNQTTDLKLFARGTAIGIALAAFLLTVSSCTDVKETPRVAMATPRPTVQPGHIPPHQTPRTTTTVRAVTTSSSSTTTTVRAATTTTEPDYHDLPDWYIWHKIGRCEQPGPGPDGIDWTHDPNSSYPGGLGILRSSWNGYRREAGITITNGAHATPYQQILVARAIRKHFGLTGWTSVPDCTGQLP